MTDGDMAVTGAGAVLQSQGPLQYRLTIAKVTSFLVFTKKRSITITGTDAVVRAAYKKVLVHNLLFGWWGIPVGLIWTPWVLIGNARALRQLNRLVGA